MGILKGTAASLRRRLDARLPQLEYRVRVSITPCAFRGGRNGVWVGFSRGFTHFPLPKISLYHLSALISFISFHFISSAPVMVLQAWSADILAIHRPSFKELHCDSYLDSALCRTRAEDTSLQTEKPRLQFCRRQVFHRK